MENNGIIFENTFNIWSALHIAEVLGEVKELESYVLSQGYTKEDIEAVNKFIDDNVDESLFYETAMKKAFSNYIKGLEGIKNHISIDDMANGYMEMGNINLQIAEGTQTNLDREGVNVDEENEMDKATTEVEINGER